jgi:hypothetical protein
MAYQTGASEAVARAGLGPEQQQGSVRVEAGSTAGTLSLTNGVFELANASKANRLAFTNGLETSVGTMFGGEMRAVEIQVSGPFAPSETMVPMAFRLALDEVIADDALWQLIDAGGKLPHDPARLVIDVAGTARITGSLTDLRPGDAAPVEIGTVAIRSAEISALGAGATASGDVEFQQPGNRPVGTVTVTLNKAEEMMVNLVDAGLVDPVTVQTLMLMATAFTAPGAQAGELVSKIVMSADGITVNGQPMGGN